MSNWNGPVIDLDLAGVSIKSFNGLSDIVKAQLMATQAHGHQKRKYSGDPYIVHPSRVANSIIEFLHCYQGGNPGGDFYQLYICAYLHDTLEDTELSEKEILDNFGPEVLQIVKELTNIPSEKAKFANKAEYLKHKILNEMSLPAIFIKLLDRRDNINDWHMTCLNNPDSVESAHRYVVQTRTILGSIYDRYKYHCFLPIVLDILKICEAIMEIPIPAPDPVNVNEVD